MASLGEAIQADARPRLPVEGLATLTQKALYLLRSLNFRNFRKGVLEILKPGGPCGRRSPSRGLASLSRSPEALSAEDTGLGGHKNKCLSRVGLPHSMPDSELRLSSGGRHWSLTPHCWIHHHLVHFSKPPNTRTRRSCFSQTQQLCSLLFGSSSEGESEGTCRFAVNMAPLPAAQPLPLDTSPPPRGKPVMGLVGTAAGMSAHSGFS